MLREQGCSLVNATCGCVVNSMTITLPIAVLLRSFLPC
jgi:hypothetical protein